MLRRRGSCDSKDCKEQSFAFDSGDRDLDVDELRLEEEEGNDLTAILPLVVFAVVTLRPRVVVALELEDGGVLLGLLGLAFDFLASTFSASRGDRRRG